MYLDPSCAARVISWDGVNPLRIRPVLNLFFLCILSGAVAQATLIDRYSFDTDGTDSVGGNNATLFNGASVSGGALQLDGTNQYASLPIGGVIAGLDSFTIEVWFTWVDNGQWARLFDFGQDDTSYMFLTPRNGRIDNGSPIDTPRFAISTGGAFGEQQLNAPDAITAGSPAFLAVTFDLAGHTAVLYVNGVAVNTNTSMTLAPSDLGNTVNNWLGRSQFASNPYFEGSIDELRIHDTVLSASGIGIDFETGPDDVVIPEPASLLLLLGGLGAFALRRVRL
jgi:hypothetical protein